MRAGAGRGRGPAAPGTIVFAVWALALQTWPVAYTLHLGEVNLILAALIGADLLRPGTGPGGRASAPGWPPGSSSPR